MTWEEFINVAIPVPFLEKGRDYRGWDCWGLVCCGYRDVLDVGLPSWDDDYFSTHQFRHLDDLFDVGLNEIAQECKPKVGAVVVMRRRRLRIHAGIVMPQKMVIHAEEGIGTVQQPIKDVRVEGFYEPKR